jgi:hypothetical protein
VAVFVLAAELFRQSLYFGDGVDGNHILSRPVVFVLDECEHSSDPVHEPDEFNLVDIFVEVELKLMLKYMLVDILLVLQARQC